MVISRMAMGRGHFQRVHISPMFTSPVLRQRPETGIGNLEFKEGFFENDGPGMAQVGRRFSGSLLLQREHGGLEPQGGPISLPFGDGVYHPFWSFWGWFILLRFTGLAHDRDPNQTTNKPVWGFQ